MAAAQQAIEDAFAAMTARMQGMEAELTQQRAGRAQSQAQTEAVLSQRLQAMEGELLAQRAQNAVAESGDFDGGEDFDGGPFSCGHARPRQAGHLRRQLGEVERLESCDDFVHGGSEHRLGDFDGAG